MDKTVVDIITRTKNRPSFLERNIKSVLKQKYQNWHHIIVNDGGNQQEVDVLLLKYKDQYQNKLSVIHNRTSIGMEAASNAGINKGNGEFITILDDDDTWEDDYLEKCVSFLERKPAKEFRGVVSWTMLVKEKVSNERIVIVGKERYTKDLYTVELAEMLKNNLYSPCSFLFERSSINVVGLYNPELPVLGDWDFNIRFLSNFEIGVVPYYMANYHIRPYDKNSTTGNSIFEKKDLHTIFRTLIKNNFLRKDLKDGKVGIGTLIALLKENQNTDNRVKELVSASLILRFKKKLKKILGKND